MSYGYNRDAGGRLLNNKLRHVNDAVDLYQHPDDLDNQDDDDNYRYDALGNLMHDTQEGIDNIDWTVYGKVRSIGKTDGTQISYAYNPSGQRVSKTLNGITTWYVRDAQGNTMGLYDNRNGANNWREQHLYGSSRLGIWQPNVDLGASTGTAAWDTIGNKSYELVNHLSNVMATISDKRLQHSSDGTGIDYFDADVQSAQEYYAFGAIIKGTAYNAPPGNGYRYGFNGKENDNEVKKDQDGNPNVGTQQDYGMRIYDPRLGRFLSVDPLYKSFPALTPFQFASNTPVQAIDLDGEESKIVVNQTQKNGTIIQIASENYVVKQSMFGVSVTVDNSGVLGRGTYNTIYSTDGKSFTETWKPEAGNSIPAFSQSGINSQRWGEFNSSLGVAENYSDRLNARLLQKETQNALISMGFNKDNVNNDVSILETDDKRFKGKFATFKEGTQSKYTSNWSSRPLTNIAHQSNKAFGSGALGTTGFELKFYDGASSLTDKIPNQIDFTRTGLSHYIDFLKTWLPKDNIGADNAASYKNQIEQKSNTNQTKTINH